jgi:signal transduction histidine kinase
MYTTKDISQGLCEIVGALDGLGKDVRRIIDDCNGRIWAATRHGLSAYDNRKVKTFTNQDGLPSNDIRCLALDQTGRIWAGTAKGLVILHSQTIEKTITLESGLCCDDIVSLCAAADGSIWIAGRHGLSRFFENMVILPLGSKDLANCELRAVHAARGGETWIGCWGDGLFLHENDTLKQFTTKDGLISDHIRWISEAEDRSVWIGTRDGLSIFRDGRFENKDSLPGMQDDGIWCIRHGNEGLTWVGMDGGLLLTDGTDYASASQANGIAHHLVYDICLSQSGSTWLACGPAGMQRCDIGIGAPSPDYVKPPEFKTHDQKMEIIKGHADDYFTIVERSREGLVVLDQTTTILFANPAAHTLLGRAPDSLIGTSFPISPGEADWIETSITRLDGTRGYGEVEFSQTEWKGSLASLVTIRDITERKRIEQDLRETSVHLSKALIELKKTQSKIIEHERMSALGQMASGIAHNFNNALTPILGVSELMVTYPDLLDDRDSAIEMLSDIHNAAKTAAQTIKSLREFYRKNRNTQLTEIDLEDVVHEVISLTHFRWREEMHARNVHIDIIKDLDDVPLIVGNAHQLQEAITNIALNGLDAMPDGGTLSFSLKEEKGQIILTISDTGIGMDEPTRKRCMEPFFTTKGDHGTGIGLSMTHGIINQHNGLIEIQSEEGQGTTFIIRFQITSPKEDRNQAGDTIVRTGPFPRSLNILVIDDEKAIRQLLERYLQSDQHTVTSLEDCDEAISLFTRHSFDLVITDRAMPSHSGDFVASEIKKVDPDVPVIMLTGFGDMMIDSGEQPASVDLIVSKPISKSDLRHAMHQAFQLKQDAAH